MWPLLRFILSSGSLSVCYGRRIPVPSSVLQPALHTARGSTLPRRRACQGFPDEGPGVQYIKSSLLSPPDLFIIPRCSNRCPSFLLVFQVSFAHLRSVQASYSCTSSLRYRARPRGPEPRRTTRLETVPELPPSRRIIVGVLSHDVPVQEAVLLPMRGRLEDVRLPTMGGGTSAGRCCCPSQQTTATGSERAT